LGFERKNGEYLVDPGIGRIILNILVHFTVSSQFPRISSFKLDLMHDTSTSASIFLNVCMIRCRQHQHCSHIWWERTCVPNHL